ncbi:MAG: dihydrodipicolinate synthase family protein [Melioribacteraceae bacterium]|jgi:4-hydroxy-2-oxoglutarate aldolase|nr:dihydrodipicolinate synthase family protein [Melioribacteraceae bacterium]
MKKLKGIFPPITTPFINDELAVDKLAFNIHMWNKTELSGYVVMGSNGESVFLTKEEKLELVAKTKEYSNKDKLIIAGTGSDSIKETIDLTNKAAGLGADFALILTPSFYKSEMKHSSYVRYFTKIADSIKIPLIIYNVPKFTGVDIEAETVAELSQHKNIVGIKNSSENSRQNSEFVSMTNSDFSVLVGTASMLFSGITSGAVGGIAALANIAPNECVQIQKLITDGKLEVALALQQKMIPINKAVTAKFGVAGLKAAMDLLGYFGGEPRVPLSSLNENDKLTLQQILKNADLLK